MEYKGKLYGRIAGQTYFDTGHTTDEWDKMEAKIKELEKPKIKFEVGKWYTTNLGYKVEFIRDIKRDGQYNVFRHTKENDYRPYYADENGVVCDGDYIITESNLPKRKPLPDGTLPLTESEKSELSEMMGYENISEIFYDNKLHFKCFDKGWRIITDVKAILYLANLFDLEV